MYRLNCFVCGKIFEGKASNQRYCTEMCRMSGYAKKYAKKAFRPPPVGLQFRKIMKTMKENNDWHDENVRANQEMYR